jgi:hypothetical protein
VEHQHKELTVRREAFVKRKQFQRLKGGNHRKYFRKKEIEAFY